MSRVRSVLIPVPRHPASDCSPKGELYTDGLVASTTLTGAELAGYRIEAVAGRGGMGIVYRAWHLGLERPVALKVISPGLASQDEFRARFRRESRLAAALDHPHVLPIYEA